MRAYAFLPFTLLLAGFSASALAEANTLCDYQLKYDIAFEEDGLLLHNAKTAPDVRVLGDRLWVGTQEQPLNAAERQRLADYRRELSGFTREVTRVALEGAQLGIEGAVLAITALTGDEDGGRAMMRRFDGVLGRLQTQLDGRHLPAQLLGKPFDDELDTAIDEAAEEAIVAMSGGIARLVAISLFAPSRMEARAEHIEKLVDTQIEPRGKALERRADALCAQVRRLDALENSVGRFNAFDRDAPSI